MLIGDAVHNLRCALDHAWWDLACHHLKRTPTEEEAPSIQFPIVKRGGTWDSGNHRRWVGQAVADFAGSIQPDYTGEPQELGPLVVLRHLSNVDKHRSMHLSVLTGQDLTLRMFGPEDVHDCVPEPRMTPEGMAAISVEGDVHRPCPNQKLASVFVVPTGPNPDVDLKANFRAYVGISGDWDILECLDAVAEGVGRILNRLLEFQVR